MNYLHQAWVETQQQIIAAKHGEIPAPTRCVMATQDRISLGLCLGEIPSPRAKRGAHFCSVECHSDYRKVRSFYKRLVKCRECGRPLKPRKSQSEAGNSVPSAVVGVEQP